MVKQRMIKGTGRFKLDAFRTFFIPVPALFLMAPQVLFALFRLQNIAQFAPVSSASLPRYSRLLYTSLHLSSSTKMRFM